MEIPESWWESAFTAHDRDRIERGFRRWQWHEPGESRPNSIETLASLGEEFLDSPDDQVRALGEIVCEKTGTLWLANLAEGVPTTGTSRVIARGLVLAHARMLGLGASGHPFTDDEVDEYLTLERVAGPLPSRGDEIRVEGELVDAEEMGVAEAQAQYLLTLERIVGPPPSRDAIVPAEDALLAFLAEADRDAFDRSALDLHFFCMGVLAHHYRRRKLDTSALDKAIAACEKQILNAPRAAAAFAREMPWPSGLPAHTGFHQLAIIREKQADYEAAIALCEEARKQGWDGDWEKRITRCGQRLDRRQGIAGPVSRKPPGPSFTIKSGRDRLQLVYEVRLPGQLRASWKLNDSLRCLSRTGANSVLHDIDPVSGRVRDSVSGLPPFARAAFDSTGWGVGLRPPRAMGTGPTAVTFLTSSGQIAASSTLPDSATQAAFADEMVAIGCCDGFIYAFDAEGRDTWKWKMPTAGRHDGGLLDRSPYPYFVVSTSSLFVTASWGWIYALDFEGHCLWEAKLPRRSREALRHPIWVHRLVATQAAAMVIGTDGYLYRFEVDWQNREELQLIGNDDGDKLIDASLDAAGRLSAAIARRGPFPNETPAFFTFPGPREWPAPGIAWNTTLHPAGKYFCLVTRESLELIERQPSDRLTLEFSAPITEVHSIGDYLLCSTKSLTAFSLKES